MSDSRPVATPLEPNTPLRKSEPDSEIGEYQLANMPLPEQDLISHTPLRFSQFSSAPNQMHCTERHTGDCTTPGDQTIVAAPHGLLCYSDSSYASNLDDRRSFSRYVARLGEASISWASKKQESAAVSTTEAEYMAMSITSRHLTWLQPAMAELKQPTMPGTVATKNHDIDYLPGGNQGALELARNHRIPNGRSISTSITTTYASNSEPATMDSTEDNLADLLTKIFPKPRHHELAERIRFVERGEVSK